MKGRERPHKPTNQAFLGQTKSKGCTVFERSHMEPSASRERIVASVVSDEPIEQLRRSPILESDVDQHDPEQNGEPECPLLRVPGR